MRLPPLLRGKNMLSARAVEDRFTATILHSIVNYETIQLTFPIVAVDTVLPLIFVARRH